jgi:hypothetical protein
MAAPNWKGILQEWAAQRPVHCSVSYVTKRVGGKDHSPDFLCTLKIGSVQVKAHGTSKPAAEKAAARIATERLYIPSPDPEDDMPELEEVQNAPPYEGAFVFPPESIWSSTSGDYAYANRVQAARSTEQRGSDAAAAMHDKFHVPHFTSSAYILQVGQGRQPIELSASLPQGVTCIGILNEQFRKPVEARHLPDWVTVVKNKNFFINMVFFHMGQFAARNEPVTLVSPTISSMPQLCQLLTDTYPRLTIGSVMPRFLVE